MTGPAEAIDEMEYFGSDVDFENIKRFADVDRLMCLVMDAFPGYVTIKDYDRADGTLLAANGPAIEFSTLPPDYYGKSAEEVIRDGEIFREEDLMVVNERRAMTFPYTGHDGRHWRKHKFLMEDGDREYLVMVAVETHE